MCESTQKKGGEEWVINEKGEERDEKFREGISRTFSVSDIKNIHEKGKNMGGRTKRQVV